MKLFYGNNDPFYSLKQVKNELNLIKENNINFSAFEYDGKHKIESAPLNQLYIEIENERIQKKQSTNS